MQVFLQMTSPQAKNNPRSAARCGDFAFCKGSLNPWKCVRSHAHVEMLSDIGVEGRSRGLGNHADRAGRHLLV